jgi:hypothetical protein
MAVAISTKRRIRAVIASSYFRGILDVIENVVPCDFCLILGLEPCLLRSMILPQHFCFIVGKE